MYSIALWTQMCPLRQKTKPWRWEPAWTLELPYHPPWLAHKHGAESCSTFSLLQSSCQIWKQSILKSRSEVFLILSDCLLPHFHPVHHQVPYPMLYIFFFNHIFLYSMFFWTQPSSLGSVVRGSRWNKAGATAAAVSANVATLKGKVRTFSLLINTFFFLLFCLSLQFP